MYKTQDESLNAARRMTSAERIAELSGGFVDNDILTVEIEHRCGVPQHIAEIVTVYELLHTEDLDTYPTVYLDVLAEVIGALKEAPESETEGIGEIDTETAWKVLECEDEIYWDCGINY